MAVQVASVTSQSAIVSWDGPSLNNMGDYYQVLYWKISGTMYDSMRVEGGATSTQLNNLSEFARYRVQVRVSCDSGGFGRFSGRASFTTLSSSEL